MIIPMARVRVLGPRPQLGGVLEAVQGLNLVHLTPPKATGTLRPVSVGGREERHAAQLRRLARELEPLAAARARHGGKAPAPATTGDFARWARLAGRLQRALRRLETRRKELEEERVQIARFLEFGYAFHGLLPGRQADRMRAYHLIIRVEEQAALPRLREALSEVLGEQYHVETTRLSSGELAALLLVSAAEAARVEQLLARAGIHELPVPPKYGNRSMGELLPELTARLQAIDGELAQAEAERETRLREATPELSRARLAVEDHLLEMAALEQAAETSRGFVLEGWMPVAGLGRLRNVLALEFGPEVVVEAVDREEWRGEDAPVVLTNPRLFRPFEAITGMLPLPRYGSIDPTPFVAVFFPMFFGMILGDIGYGMVLAVVALLLRARTAPGSRLRAVAEIAGACAAFSVAFGVAFGELFGDLGRHWFGLHPLLLDRERSLLPFLGLTIAIGLVHMLLGLALGIINAARGHPRQAVGRGVALLMVILIVIGLLAAVGVLPRRLLSPVTVALLVAFPVLIVAEGIIAPIEFLSTISNILSYARIMALGTASVMMAIAANQLAGSMGSVLVGIVFGLLFHLVNFALGVFAPTVHGLRLHYVEFFGKFYSPGGHEYRPFGHWRPTTGGTA